MGAIQKLAAEVGDASQLCDALAGVLRQQVAQDRQTPTRHALPLLECALAAVQVIPKLKEPVRPNEVVPACT